jgi:hypothetical protein
MKRGQLLTITSLVSILLMTFHVSDDIVRGMEPGGLKNLIGILILVVWLVGALVVRERIIGIVILLLGALLGTGVPVVHMMGSGLVGGEIADSGGVFFWVWTNIALGVTSVFGFILSTIELLGRMPRESE